MAALGRRARAAVLGALLVATPARAAPPGPGVSDVQVKAAFLYSFARYTQWPAAEAGAAQPFVIAILGVDPFGEVLDGTLRGKAVAGAPVALRRIARPDELEQVRILYVSESEADRLARILKRVEGSAILTVGEMGRFAARGGMVEMRTDGSRIRLEINLAAAERVGLRISSELLKLARIVGPPEGY